MRTRKSTVARLVMLGSAGLLCLGSSYTWTGDAGGNDFDWDNSNNWDCTACAGFPDDGNDDALFPADTGSWIVKIVEDGGGDPYEIDDLTINDDTNVTGSADVTVSVDTLTINGGSSSDTEVTIINNDVAIVARTCN